MVVRPSSRSGFRFTYRWSLLPFLGAIGACARVAPPPSKAPAGAGPRHETAQPRQPCASEPLRSTGRVHYVCDCQAGADPRCAAGQDRNAGTTPNAPLQSYAKAAEVFASMQAGDTVAFCRGGRWNLRDGAAWANPRCRRDATCDIRDYVPAWGRADSRPPSFWIDGGGAGATLMSFIHPPAHFEGYRVLNLDLHGGSDDVALFFFNETTDVDLCNIESDGFGITVHIAGGDGPRFGVSSNIVLRNSRITNNANIAYLGVCDHCSVEDNFFDNNGARDVLTHTIYFASQAHRVRGRSVVHTARGMRLARNRIHHTKQVCRGAPVVVHGRHQDVVIEDNVIDAAQATDACWGPGVGCGGYGYGCAFRNTLIRNNVVKGLGNVGSDNSNCTGCTIENNLFVMNRDGIGISVGGTKPRSDGDSDYAESDGVLDDPANFAVIRNNTFYFEEAATSAAAITIFSGIGHVIENNAIAFAATDPKESVCYRLLVPPTAALAGADFNLCTLDGSRWVGIPPGPGITLAEWQKAGFDRHSRQAAPMFDDPPASFVPASGSPLIDGADPTNCPRMDITRKTRDARPDIGAYER